MYAIKTQIQRKVFSPVMILCSQLETFNLVILYIVVVYYCILKEELFSWRK